MLVPVFFGVTASDVRRVPQLESLALTEVQAIKDLHGLPLARKLGTLLAPLRAALATGARGSLEHKIANHLAGVKRQALLDEVAQQLDVDLGG